MNMMTLLEFAYVSASDEKDFALRHMLMSCILYLQETSSLKPKRAHIIEASEGQYEYWYHQVRAKESMEKTTSIKQWTNNDMTAPYENTSDDQLGAPIHPDQFDDEHDVV